MLDYLILNILQILFLLFLLFIFWFWVLRGFGCLLLLFRTSPKFDYRRLNFLGILLLIKLLLLKDIFHYHRFRRLTLDIWGWYQRRWHYFGLVFQNPLVQRFSQIHLVFFENVTILKKLNIVDFLWNRNNLITMLKQKWPVLIVVG